jgi:uncharacterized alkaline shock family protein YloU
VSGQALISPDVLARYAGDAAREVAGVADVAGKGVKVGRQDGRVTIELPLALTWGANAAAVGAAVQTHVVECLARMADVRPYSVDVVVEEWRSASSG